MDIRLKNNKNKLLVNLIIIVILVSCSIGMYTIYPRIKKIAEKQGSNFKYGNDLIVQLRNNNYAIFNDLLNKSENKNLKPSDHLLKNIDISKNATMTDKEYVKTNLDEVINYSKNYLENNKNLQYYAIDKQSRVSAGRNQNELLDLINKKPFDEKTAAKLNENYAFYIVIDYNEAGDITISTIYGVQETGVNEVFNQSIIEANEYYEVVPIKNMTYIYAVPKNLKYMDNIYAMKRFQETSSYDQVSSIYVKIFFLLIMLLSLMIPYRLSKDMAGFKMLSELPAEIIIITYYIILYFISRTQLIIFATIKNELVMLPQLELSPSLITKITHLVNIIYWTAIFSAVFYLITLLKHIVKTGVKEYLEQYSIIVRIIQKAIKDLVNINLLEKNTGRIVSLLSINFLILLIIMIMINSMRFYGVFIAVIYSIVLFILIRRNYGSIRTKYKRLHAAIAEISSGNLDISVDEDLGVFNGLKKEIKGIQKGFKKAVHEEVKSQKMKTELISNVSHDLKTPLTAIITYVDLLKDSGLSEDKRSEYLNILDMKSQRLKDLIEDLFEISKATSGNISLNIVDVDVVALMKQTLLEVEDKLSKASLNVKTNYSEGKIILPLDSQRTYRIFENLLVNISKYAMPGSRVYIDIISLENKVQIVLKNMSSEEMKFKPDEILERFVRGDKSRNSEGAGIGLSIAKSFVEIQGGQMEIQIDGDLFKVIIEFKNKI